VPSFLSSVAAQDAEIGRFQRKSRVPSPCWPLPSENFTAIALEASYFGICAATEDKKEGTSAFLEKRAPQFSRTLKLERKRDRTFAMATPSPTPIPTERFRLTSSDGLCIACARWDSRGPARAVVQIAHGMGEHMGRYADTVDALVAAGLTVYANDHRGHGLSAHAQLGELAGAALNFSSRIWSA